jgi:hypothetical protein|tara:strand:+ start:929 stop:1354 length:426 start_codon:yes stop_codon:yes gene_type:complete
MKAIKEVWDKLKYWQKGGVIGLFIGVLFNLYLYTNKSGYDIELLTIFNVHLRDSLFHLVPLMLYSFIFDSAINTNINFINLTMVIIWYILVGILFGLIYKFIKDKYPNYSVPFFISTIFAYAIIIVVVNFLILMLLLAKAA